MKSQQNRIELVTVPGPFASFCGKTKLTGPRDAYLAAICKASLPPHYTLNVLKATPSTQNVSGPSAAAKGAPGGTEGVPGGGHPTSIAAGESDIRHQVVAVGTPLPTASLPTSAHQVGYSTGKHSLFYSKGWSLFYKFVLQLR